MSIAAITRARAIAVVTAIGLIFGGALAVQPAFADSAPPNPSDPSTPTTITDDVLPTPQINGVAWAQVVVGNTVYVAGSFTTARPAGSAAGVNTVARNNLLAYDITTGVLNPTFAPNLNAQALTIAASPDGSRIYVGGDFTSIDGKGAYRLAAFSTATGAVVSTFKPIMGSEVRAVTATNSAVWAGGTFTTVNGASRMRFAAVNASDGSTLPFVADVNDAVNAVAVTTDGARVVVGGRFNTINGASNIGLGMVDSGTGTVLPFAANQSVQDSGSQAAIVSLTATSDRIYGSGYVFGAGGNLEGIFAADPNTGSIIWIEDCHGDTYSVFPHGDAVYQAGHSHYCGNIGGFPQTNPWTMHHSLAFSKAVTGTIGHDPYGYHDWFGNPSPSLLDWFPTWTNGNYTSAGQAGWSVAGNANYVVYGGEFPSVNGVQTQGLARFANPNIAPNKVGPQGVPLTPTAVSFASGQARVSFAATYDNDNGYLTYKIYRDSGANPVYTTTVHSNFYTRPMVGFIDTGLTPGTTHVYHVRVYDPFNNTTSRDTNSVVIAGGSAAGSTYSDAVTASNATSSWPFDEASGTSVFDHVGFNDLVANANVTRGAAGPVSGVNATTFDGSAGVAVTQTAIPGPNTFTAEAWFRTTTTTGGKILGFGDQNSALSNSYDRHIYMDNSGKIWFGVYPGGVQTLTSTKSYNDGNWHQVVASLGPNGMVLYMDGKQVAARGDVTFGQGYNGYWKVGGDNLNGWPSQPSSPYFKGDIGQVSMYSTVLNRTDVLNHWVASGRVSPFPPAPTDAYGNAIYKSNPDIYWRLSDSGNTAADAGPLGNPGTFSGTSPTQGLTGAVAGTTDTATRFNGSNNGQNGTVLASSAQFSNPTTYSLELWFNTTTHTGGKLIGFGNNQTGLSSNYDRHVYMQDNGQLVFGVWTGQTNTITSPSAYNDGNWHYVVATQAGDGMKMYVDGALVGTNGQSGQQAYNGYWRVGGDNTWGSTGPYFKGTIDEVAVYSSELSATDVTNHYSLGTSGTVPNQPPTASFSSSAAGLNASFDGSGSSDPEGPIASYSWNFGDSSALGTGATPTHTFASTGTYQVTLTVTDGSGATNSVTNPITVTDTPPVAAFTPTPTNLSVAFDSSGSSDPDGTIASYAWDFGDGGTDTVANPSHTYAAGGTYHVSLTVTDNSGTPTTVTHDVTVSPANQPPVAAFSATPTNLTVAVDASASTDDGTITGYAWNWGDGSAAGSGKTTSHTYAGTGTYTITLTVTDNGTLTNSATKSVSVTAPNNALAQDAFGRTVSGGWGTGDIGGAWTLSGGATNFSVSGGTGQQVVAAGSTKTATLGSVSATSTDTMVTVSTDTVPTGGGTYIGAAGRAVGSTDYSARVWIKSTGLMTLQLMQSGTVLSSYNVPTLTYTAGMQLNLHLQVFGTSPTTIRAKVWPTGQTEPTAWQLSATDSTAALQVAGSVNLRTYTSSTSSVTPVTTRFSSYTVNPGP